MIVTKVTAGSVNNIKKKKPAGGGGAFAASLNESDEASAPATASVNSPTAVSALFMLQEIEGDGGGKQQQVERGFDMLDYLDNIKVGLLTGTISREMLSGLDEMISKWRENTDDPKLEAIIDEIELRAAVELAKLEMA